MHGFMFYLPWGFLTDEEIGVLFDAEANLMVFAADVAIA